MSARASCRALSRCLRRVGRPGLCFFRVSSVAKEKVGYGYGGNVPWFGPFIVPERAVGFD